MRIGSWNLAGRWTPEHADLLRTADCDVWLLTEVPDRLELPGYHHHRGAAPMAPRRRWAAVLAREGLRALPDPHPASAMARVGALTFTCSVLPWRGCGSEPWGEGGHAERTARTLDQLLATMTPGTLVWGGDWNHALTGREYAGSQGGRQHLLDALDSLGLMAPTANQPHAVDGLLSIDHIAVAAGSAVSEVRRVSAAVGDRRLSDHDAYLLSLG